MSTFSPDLLSTPADKIFYALTMFPYPSGVGLHAGHASVFTINDVIARYKTMSGYTVLNPFGFDAFGLPTENYALQENKLAREVTDTNKAMFLDQVKALNISFDYERVIDTSMPDYYKWTQWIFTKLMEAGLVYRDEKFVNRCPVDQTVLANDQVVDGKCERCKAEIIQKKHMQWFIKITDYADRLISDLDLIDRPEETKTTQKNWIGRSEGAEIDFKISNSDTTLTVFTTRPDTLYGVTAVVLAPENTLIDELLSEDKKSEIQSYRNTALAKTAVQRQQDVVDKTGVFSELYAIHPLTGESVPVWFADYVLMDYGSGAVMMVPAHDERDREFAHKFRIEVKQVIRPFFDIFSNKNAAETIQRNGVLGIVKHPFEDKYLVLEENQNDFDQTFYMFPSGGTEEGDKSLKDTLKREIVEETGYTDIGSIIELNSSLNYIRGSKEKNYTGRYIGYAVQLNSLTQINQGEHMTDKHNILWLTQEEIIQKVTLPQQLYFWSSYHNGYTGTGSLINSAQFDGLDSIEAKSAIISHLESLGVGKRKITYRLRDRSVSRQRYRGSPIPVYYDENNTPQPIQESELPVILPLDVTDFKPKGKSPLEDHPTFKYYTPQNYKVPYFEFENEWKYRPEAPIQVRQSVAIILRDTKKEKICTLHRVGLDINTLILGGKEDGDSYEETIRKEIKEETGYNNIGNIREIGKYQSKFWHVKKERNQYNITRTFVCELLSEDNIGQQLEENEALETKWMKPQDYITIGSNMETYFIKKEFYGVEEWNGQYTNHYNEYNPKPTYLRECDTLDTFMCSSFYFLRFPDAHNDEALIRKELADKCLPVDFYSGGKEHSVGHLLYSRFIHKFLYDQGYVSSPEPFMKLVHQGMVLGADGRKMGKRYNNGVDPLEIVEKYGSDAVRTYLMFMGPIEADKVRNDNALNGIKKFLDRVEKLPAMEWYNTHNDDVIATIHDTIIKVTEDIESYKFNTAVSKLMIAVNTIYDHKAIDAENLAIIAQLLSPFSPILAQKLWEQTGKNDDIAFSSWPIADTSKITMKPINFPIQINGKMRGTLIVPAGISEQELLALVHADDYISKYLTGTTKKVIFVADKIMNIINN